MIEIKIGKRKIGYKEPPFIIAEIGINHQGSLSLCKKMIASAAKSGADAVKLQTINVDESYMSKTLSYEVFKNKNFTFNQLNELKLFAKKKDLQLFTTPGDISSLSKIKKLKFTAIKISSGLFTNLPLIKESIKLSKPLILSTGMIYEKELKIVLNYLKKNKFHKFVILQCTAKYPNDDEDVNLKTMNYIKDKYKCLVGYSDHTLDDLACLNAVSLGACVIEKHFTIDNSIKGGDNTISMMPDDFREMVKKIHRIKTQQGNYKIAPTTYEKKKRINMHRYFVTSKFIRKDSLFSLSNLNMKRLSNINNGIPAIEMDKVFNKKSSRNIKKDSVLNKKDIKQSK